MGRDFCDIGAERRAMLQRAGLPVDALPNVEELANRLLPGGVRVMCARTWGAAQGVRLVHLVWGGHTVQVREGLPREERREGVARCLATWWLGRLPGWNVCPDREGMILRLGRAILEGRDPGRWALPLRYACRAWLELPADKTLN